MWTLGTNLHTSFLLWILCLWHICFESIQQTERVDRYASISSVSLPFSFRISQLFQPEVFVELRLCTVPC